MTALPIWLQIFASAGLFVLCDSLAANWGKTGASKSLLVVLLLGPLAYIVFGLLNQSKSLAVSSVMVNILVITGGVLVSIFIFRETLSLREWVGLGFGAIALILMSGK